jgi:hypothetical protein
MKRGLLLLCLLGFFLALSPSANAQFHLSLAPIIGMNFNLHTGSDLGSTGTGVGMVFGGQAIMSFSPSLGLVEGITFYDNRSGSTSRTYPSKQYPDATANEDASISLAYIQLENLFMLKLPRTGFYFVAGPVLGFNIEGSTETTVKTVANYDPNQSVSTKTKASMKDVLVRFELKLGAGYDFPITKNLFIFPQVTFGFGLTKVVSDVSWRVLTFQAIGGVKFIIL